MKVIITFTFCCDNLWKSKFMALEKPEKLGELFSPTLWPPCQAVNDIKQYYSPLQPLTFIFFTLAVKTLYIIHFY